MDGVDTWVDVLGDEGTVLGERDERAAFAVVLYRYVLVRLSLTREPAAVVCEEWDRRVMILVRANDNHLTILGMDGPESRVCRVFVSERGVGSPVDAVIILLVEDRTDDYPRLKFFFGHPETFARWMS